MNNSDSSNKINKLNIRSVAVIGATGKLAFPVVTHLSLSFIVRAIVRPSSIQKAKKMYKGHNIEIVEGDLTDLNSLIRGFTGMDSVYINLSTETLDSDLSFYSEREGVYNIVQASKQTNIQYITKIGALGAYPLSNRKGPNVFPNIIRIQGNKYIETSGIAYTLFDPTFFMDTLEWIINKGELQWIGKAKHKLYWISGLDYAKQVVKAFNNPLLVLNEHVPIQGPEPLDPFEAMELFKNDYDPSLKITAFPLWLVQCLGIFSSKMKFMGHMFAYFESSEDEFYSAATWQKLGKPTETLKQFAIRVKQEKENKNRS